MLGCGCRVKRRAIGSSATPPERPWIPGAWRALDRLTASLPCAKRAIMSPPDSVVRVAAIDLGKARVGIAVSDDLGLLAHPRPFLDGKSRKPLIAALVAMVRDEGIQRFLVGLPLEMTGEEGPAARRIMTFAQELANASGVEIELIDERLTTVEAAQRLRSSGIGAREGKGLVD